MGTIVPNMGAIVQYSRIAEALLGSTKRRVLALLFSQPERAFYTRQIIRLIGVKMGAVQRELLNLADAGIINRRKDGNRILYQANPECPVYPELRGLMIKTFGVADKLKDALLPLVEQISSAFVYGSFASGEFHSKSDVDVLIIGKVSSGDVVNALYPLQEELMREINSVVMSQEEYQERIVRKNHFLATVLKGEKLFLIGDANELGKMG